MAREVQKMPAVGEKTGPAMCCGLGAIDGCHGKRQTPGRRHAIDGVRGRWAKDDGSIVAPASTTSRLRSAQCLGWTTGCLNSSQISISKEADRPAVGRPERKSGALGARERRGSRRVNPSYE